MRTTIGLPGTLFRQVKAVAAARGISLKRFFTEALREQLRRGAKEDVGEIAEPPWMAGFGGLSDLGDEHRRILEAIDDEFEGVSPESLARSSTQDRR